MKIIKSNTIMKKVLLFLACVALGVMASGCAFDDVVEQAGDYEYSCGYKELTDTSYLSWIKSNGEEFAVEIEYASSKMIDPYSNIKRVSDVSAFDVVKVKKDVRTDENGYVFEDYEYQICVIAKGVKTMCYYETSEPNCALGRFPVVKPVFSLVGCQLISFEEDTDNSDYWCSEYSVAINVQQDEKKYREYHTFKIKDHKQEIKIIPSVGGWVDEEVDLDI